MTGGEVTELVVFGMAAIWADDLFWVIVVSASKWFGKNVRKPEGCPIGAWADKLVRSRAKALNNKAEQA